MGLTADCTVKMRLVDLNIAQLKISKLKPGEKK